MHAKKLVFSMALILMAGCFANTSCLADDVKAVEEAAAGFYTSLNALFTGDAALMQETWSHADDVTYMGPAGGFQVGWEEVRAYWEAQAALKLGGKVEPFEMRFFIGNDLAFV